MAEKSINDKAGDEKLTDLTLNFMVLSPLARLFVYKNKSSLCFLMK